MTAAPAAPVPTYPAVPPVQVLPRLVALQTTPTADRITEEINGEECVFELMAPGNGEPPWKYEDIARTVYRVHTKRVA